MYVAIMVVVSFLQKHSNKILNIVILSGFLFSLNAFIAQTVYIICHSLENTHSITYHMQQNEYQI